MTLKDISVAVIVVLFLCITFLTPDRLTGRDEVINCKTSEKLL